MENATDWIWEENIQHIFLQIALHPHSLTSYLRSAMIDSTYLFNRQ